jgi:steroid delta-isomerase-like uncharacterized protein
MTMSVTIDDLVPALLAAWNDHDVERVAAFYAPDYYGVDIAEASPQKGPDGIRDSMTRYVGAFPDLHFSGIEIVIQDSRVAVRWTAHGTHQGALMNIPPSGRKISVYGTSFLTLGDGKIKQGMCVWDVAGLLRSIGLLPEL